MSGFDAVVLVLCAAAGSASGCSLLGFYDELPTDCPEDPSCCSEGDPLANGGCDWTCNDPQAPDLLVTALAASPGAPESTLLRTALEGAIARGDLTWLIDVESDGASTTFRIGSGTCSDPGPCAFDADPPPSRGDGTLGSDGRLSLPTSGTFETTLVLDAPDLGVPFPLRLVECTLVGPVEAGGNCIGRRRGPSPGDWSTPARVGCEITAVDAMQVDLTAQNSTLCDLLAGCGELFCCDSPPGSWPNRPEEEVDGAPAWSLLADIAAIGVRIGE